MRRPQSEKQVTVAKGPSGSSVAVGAEPSDDGPPSKRATAPGLHLVATPIGNLGDISRRALQVLREVAVIACEDTRVSGKLLSMYEISTPLIPYHDHNAERMRPQLLRRLEEGQKIALISDAGTPLVSDPGYKLVRELLDRKLPVHVVPGASAPLAALLLSGLPSDRFFFAGFLPSRQSARRAELAKMNAIPSTLIFFEAAQRLGDSLVDMAAMLGDRPAAVARELTKLYEEVVRGSLSELGARYHGAVPPKGEIVVVVGPPLERVPDEQEIDAQLRAALTRSSIRDAAHDVALATGIPKRTVYARALALANEKT